MASVYDVLTGDVEYEKRCDYLETLFDLFDINKICFDIDYPWNTISYENQELDWNSLKRINQLPLTTQEKEKVLSKNSQKFFNL